MLLSWLGNHWYAIYKARLMYGAVSRAVRRKLGIMPIHRVLQELADRQVKVADAVALEVFAGTGDLLTKDLAAAVSSMEAWEISEAKCEMLARRLPGVRVRAVDSIINIYKCKYNYDIVSVDNTPLNFGREGEFCEHFDIFPGVFQVTADRAVLILDVVPEASRLARWLTPDLFNDSQLARRRSFYSTDTPEMVPFEKMIDTYKMLAEKSGYIVDWWFAQRRTLYLYFLVIQISRIKNVAHVGQLV